MGLTIPDPLRTIDLDPIRSKAMRVCAFLLILTTAGGASVAAQSLADVAKKESERRQAVKAGGKTYTNKDLKPVPAAPAGAAAAPEADKAADQAAAPSSRDEQTAAEAKGDAASSKSGDETSEVKDQAYWSKRMADLREQLDRDQTFLDALQNRIDSLTTDFVNRDDPAQRAQIANDRLKALAELDRLKKAIEQDKRAIPELEEEARRAGVPAGWLR